MRICVEFTEPRNEIKIYFDAKDQIKRIELPIESNNIHYSFEYIYIGKYIVFCIYLHNGDNKEIYNIYVFDEHKFIGAYGTLCEAREQITSLSESDEDNQDPYTFNR